MQTVGVEGVRPPQCVNSPPGLAPGAGVVRERVTGHDGPVAQKSILGQQDVKRPPTGPGNPRGERRGDVGAVVVRQGVEMDENAGVGAVLLVIAPQEGRLHHVDPVDDVRVSQDGRTRGCNGSQVGIAGSRRPPRRDGAKRTTVLRHRSWSQLPPPCLRRMRFIATHVTHAGDSTARRYRFGSDPAMGRSHYETDGRLALFRGGWRRVTVMTHIVLTATTAPGAQALAVMCGAQMCCCRAC